MRKSCWSGSGVSSHSAHALEGKVSIGEAQGHPLELPDPQRQGSIVGEPEPVSPKVLVHATLAQIPVLVKVLMHALNLHLGTVDIDLDTCSRPLS